MAEAQLRIYLNDHLAASVAGLELAKRAAANNRGTPLGDFLEQLVDDIIDDRIALEKIADAVGAQRNPPKQWLAWMGEKLGRAKLNGRVRGYAPLSRVLELEMLMLGIAGKLAGWHTLDRLKPPQLPAADVDLGNLIERAEQQRDKIEHFRREAVQALSSPAE